MIIINMTICHYDIKSQVMTSCRIPVQLILLLNYYSLLQSKY